MRILVAILVVGNFVALGMPTVADAQESCVNAQFNRWCLRPDPNGGPCITVDRGKLDEVTAECACSAATGHQCFESWIAEFANKANAYNGGPEFNQRKPWSINKYGVVDGGGGEHSVSKPDDFFEFRNNKYCWMWGHYTDQGPAVTPFLFAGVPPLHSYVTTCVAP